MNLTQCLIPIGVDAYENGIQPLSIPVLVAVAQGKVDLNRLARAELAARGLDRDGRWVGFADAERRYRAEALIVSTSAG